MSKVTIKYNHWYFKMPWMASYDGMVIGRTLIFKKSEDKVDKVLLNHEMIHQAQMDKVGVMGFYLKYVKDYFKNLLKYKNHMQAYLNIPFEVEAYKNQANLNYLK